MKTKRWPDSLYPPIVDYDPSIHSDLNKAVECLFPLKEHGHPFNNNNSISNRVYFNNLEAELIKHIEEADHVFACVAWLTSVPILKALIKKSWFGCVSIIIQKEKLPLQSDENVDPWKKKLANYYNSISGVDLRSFYWNNALDLIFPEEFIYLDGVRCLGNCFSDGSSTFPRMHHKFMIFAKNQDLYPCKNENWRSCKPICSPVEEYVYFQEDWEFWGLDGCFEDHIKDVDLINTAIENRLLSSPVPYGVWTGSFNMTKNASNSLENAVYLEDKDIVQAYYQEYGKLACMSEHLQWDSEWCSPEWFPYVGEQKLDLCHYLSLGDYPTWGKLKYLP